MRCLSLTSANQQKSEEPKEPKKREPSPLLTLNEAAEYVKMSRSRVQKAIRTGELEKLRFGCVVRIHKSDFEKYVESKKVKKT
jgi:excisionase family DNA binding protein